MSKRVRFTRDYDHEPRPNVFVAYKAGMTLSVPDPHADAAIAAKVAELVPDAPSPNPSAATTT